MDAPTLELLVAARKAAINTHAALSTLLTLAHTQEHLDSDGLSIVETMRPTVEAAYDSLEKLNAARPTIKPDGPHFRVIELAMAANSALIPAMLGVPGYRQFNLRRWARSGTWRFSIKSILDVRKAHRPAEREAKV